MPLQVLADLATYRELIIEIARFVFFRDRPERARVPQGFNDRFSLVLRTIERGSAAPVLERDFADPPTPTLFDIPPANDQFDEARDIVNGLFVGIVEGGKVPDEYPARVVHLMANIGRSLRPDESIEFQTPQGSGPCVTWAQFSGLAGAREFVSEEETEILGYVEAVDVSKERTFKIRTATSVITAPLPSAMEDTAIEGLKQHRDRVYRIAGSGVFDWEHNLIRFTETTAITEQKDELGERIAELAKLERGWLDGFGEAIALESIHWLTEIRKASLFGAFLIHPAIFPTPNGGCRVEWSLGRWSVSAEHDAQSRTAYFHALHLDTDQEAEGDLISVAELVDAVAKIELLMGGA